MKNADLRKTTLVIVLILASFCVYSQQKEVKNDMLSLNGVEFWHKWKPSKCFNKKSPLQLNVKVKNTNAYCVKVELQVNYYQSGIIKEQSDTVSLCLNPNQSKQGSKNGLNFSAGSFTNAEINNPAFTYEVNPIKIIKMRSCQENK
ncbi:MAG: hypothetical protein HXX18_10920 [Bacteroidetes bacterium]|nr:hypothetical protein [Bacteroidota bacterium]